MAVCMANIPPLPSDDRPAIADHPTSQLVQLVVVMTRLKPCFGSSNPESFMFSPTYISSLRPAVGVFFGLVSPSSPPSAALHDDWIVLILTQHT